MDVRGCVQLCPFIVHTLFFLGRRTQCSMKLGNENVIYSGSIVCLSIQVNMYTHMHVYTKVWPYVSSGIFI